MFNLSIAKQLLKDSADSEFVVDFDLVWQWLGYSTKGNAKRKFESSGFVAEQDFSSVIRNDKREIGASHTEEIYLTVDCVKAFCMMANTEQGKKVRSYFIEAEKYLKQLEQAKPKPELLSVANEMRLLHESTMLANIKQLLFDQMADVYLTNKQQQLTGSSERWLGVAQKAEELGYKITPRNRSVLGKWVKKQNLESRQEETRVCNGTSRAISVYLDSELLADAIHNYFSSKN